MPASTTPAAILNARLFKLDGVGLGRPDADLDAWAGDDKQRKEAVSAAQLLDWERVDELLGTESHL